jgi:hypothetical protein
MAGSIGFPQISFLRFPVSFVVVSGRLGSSRSEDTAKRCADRGGASCFYVIFCERPRVVHRCITIDGLLGQFSGVPVFCYEIHRPRQTTPLGTFMATELLWLACIGSVLGSVRQTARPRVHLFLFVHHSPLYSTFPVRVRVV